MVSVIVLKLVNPNMLHSLSKPSLLRRLFAGYVVIILSLTTVVGLLVSRQTTENSLLEIEHSLHIQAQFLSQLSMQLSKQTDKKSEQRVNQIIIGLGEKTQSRLTLINAAGRVLADSEQIPSSMDNHAQREEIIAASKSRSVAITRFSNTLQQNMLYFALPISSNDKIEGYVRVSLPLTIIDTKLAQLRIAVALSALLSALVALVLGYYFVRNFSAPLVKITAVAEAISQGDYSKRIETKQKNEIGALAKAFNRMAKTSESRMNQIVTERNRLAMIFTGMVEGVVYVDENFQIIHINQAAANMFNISAITSIKQPLANMIQNPEIIIAVSSAIADKNVVKTQIKEDSKAANKEVIDIYVAALNNDLGESAGAVIVLNDISELAYLERVRRDFVANASHELKTPITAIRGFTETILDDSDIPENIRLRFMTRIKEQTLRLSSLVTDLMSISRLEENASHALFKAIPLTETVKQAIDNATVICQEKKVSISHRLPNGKMEINGDLQEIQQLIDNLINNAIKYTPEHGNINVNLAEVDGQAQIMVQDTGIGISRKEQVRIFERFYRVDKARSRELGGTGLGLSIVKNIIEKHKGTIKVDSKLGHGSTFIATLPLR